jgi:N-acetylmuramoyl-L-alanine amidase
MVKRILPIWLAVVAAAAQTEAAPVARVAFTQAIEQEQAARAALSEPAGSAEVLKSVRKAVAAYEAIVRHHPASSYSDDALWRGGTLALDAFTKFGDAHDRTTGLRLLRLLASDYPTSKLAKRVPLFLAREDGAKLPAPLAPRIPPPAAPAPVPSAPAGGSGVRPTAEPPPITPSAAAGTVPKATVSSTAAAAVPTPEAAGPRPAAKPVRAVASASATVISKPATITAIRRAVLPDVVRIIIAVDSEVSYHDERITGPARIFIDLPATRTAASLTDRTLRFDDDADLVRQVRLGRHPNTTTRVVLDAAGVSSYSVYPIYSPYRLVIDCTRPTPGAPRSAAVATAPAPLSSRAIRLRPQPLLAGVRPPVIHRSIEPPATLVSRRLTLTWARRMPLGTPMSTDLLNAVHLPPLPSRIVPGDLDALLPSSTPGARGAIIAALTRIPPPAASAAPSASSASAPAPSATASASTVVPSASSAVPSASSAVPSASSPLSMARQLGLGVSRIVIDPGHGGHDPGAKGKAGVSEAELVLDVSLRLQKLLEKVQGVEVILTRDDDQFVSLPERTDRANREGADLFLSIHANASANDQAHGVETYFLNFATNLGASAVAARENAASGQAMAALPDFVKAIALNNKLDESRDFATIVQESLVEHLRPTNKTVKNLGVKQAPFVVLIGASMPSVLVEISFVTNPQEARLLKSGGYREKIAEALFEAVRKYQTSLTNGRTVAFK